MIYILASIAGGAVGFWIGRWWPPMAHQMEPPRGSYGPRFDPTADAATNEQALEAELRAWWRSQGWPSSPQPNLHAVRTHVTWAQHLLSRGMGA